jgi:Zn-dependent protease with chaperone function
MRFLSNLKEFPKFVIVQPHTSVTEIRNYLTQYIDQIGWSIVHQGFNDNVSFGVTAQNTRSSLFHLLVRRCPQVCVWSALQDGNGVRIEVDFKLTNACRWWLNAILSLASLFALLVSFESLILVGLTVLWVFLSGRYHDFRRDFRVWLVSKSGQQIEITWTGAAIPDFKVFLCWFAVFILFFVPVFLQIFRLPNVPIFAFTLLAAMMFGLVLWAFFRGFGPRSRDNLHGYTASLAGGVAASLYGLIPALWQWNLGLRSLSEIFHLTRFPAFWAVYLPAAILLICISAGISMTAGNLRLLFQDFQTRKLVVTRTGGRRGHRSLNTAIIAIWIFATILNLIGVRFAFLALDGCFFGRSVIFHSQLIDSLILVCGAVPARILLGAYSILPLAVLSLFLVRWFKSLFLLDRLSRGRPRPSDLVGKVTLICHFAQVRPPLIVIDGEERLTATVLNVFPMRRALRISKGILQSLSVDELDAVLAHEIWHLRSHSLRFSLLDSLSKWTLFGKGFLALALDTSEMEHKADKFSVTYLGTKGIGRDALISALEKILIINSLLKHLAPSSSLQAIAQAISKNRPVDIRTAAALFYEMYFGDIILSYVHPTIDERIERINAIDLNGTPFPSTT